MKIIVISDTHQYYRNFETILLQQKEAEAFIHLGDGESEYRLLCQAMPELADRFYCIKGNCDYGSELPQYRVIDIYPGHRIFATHGHRYGVNYSLEHLTQTARENGCDIALYGHTHVSYNSYTDGVYVLNPGSASHPRDGKAPSYGVIDISRAGVMTNVVFLGQH